MSPTQSDQLNRVDDLIKNVMTISQKERLNFDTRLSRVLDNLDRIRAEMEYIQFSGEKK